VYIYYAGSQLTETLAWQRERVGEHFNGEQLNKATYKIA
jgi:hypothetical protein